MTDPAAFWVSGLAVGSLVGAGLGFVVGVAIGSMKPRRPGHHRRGSNPMAPGCKPEPPMGPPQRPAPPPTRVVDVHGRTIGHFSCLDEGRTQRGNGTGGPTTPKPNIIPRPQGGTFNPPSTDP